VTTPAFWRKANRIVGSVLLAVVGLAALLGVFYTPFDPTDMDFTALLQPPSTTHWFGTDQYGRDLFSRVMWASALSLRTSFIAMATALLLGVSIGSASGYWAGAVDRVLTIINDSLMAFPVLLLALALTAVTGPTPAGVVIAIGLAYAPSVARVVRGIVLSVREREFVEASRVLGNSESYTLLRHILPNCVSPLTVLGTSLFASALLVESALSFLGVGVPAPAATWGGLLADSREFIGRASWLSLFPGLSICLTLLGVNLLGDALRDHLDPRMSKL
jgi:peptide/nickel transport system permease protein